MRYSNKVIEFTKEHNLNKVYCVGDIHGNFVAFADDIINSCKLKNCLVIVNGDCGFGFFSSKKMAEIFQKLQTILSPNNVYVIFFRGNHDDPEWFDYKDDNFATNYPNVIIAEDFTVVKFYYKFNILLWGGAVSIDRTNRIKNYSYWENEKIKSLPTEFDSEDFDLCAVCTHSAPDFCLPVTTKAIEGWFSRDNMLEYDLKEERETISKGAYILKRNNPRLRVWTYGHYHDSYFNTWDMNEEMFKFAGIRFIGLDMFREKYDREDFIKNRYDRVNRKHKNDLVCICDYS